jgi:hypothetical protein
MRFVERKEFIYDTELFRRQDCFTALKIQAEYVKRHSAVPTPRFFEVNRKDMTFDDLWHQPVDARMKFDRQLDIPSINTFQKPDWRITKLGLVPQRRDNFWLANLLLQEYDYFPNRGDLVYWNGYRYIIINASIDPSAYWHQTNVWLGMIVECVVAIEGDARPVLNPGAAVPAELMDTAAKAVL